MADLSKLWKLVAIFPSRSSDVRYQKQLFDEIFNVLNDLDRTVNYLAAKLEARE